MDSRISRYLKPSLTALAVYRCTLSVGLGPELDFGPPKLASMRVDPPPGEALRGLFYDAHDATQRKGPYVPAPYLSPRTFAPFAIVEKSHGFIPNFFRAQTLRPDLLEAEAEAVARILLPEDVLTKSAEGMHSVGGICGEPQLLLRRNPLQPLARIGYAFGGGRPDCCGPSSLQAIGGLIKVYWTSLLNWEPVFRNFLARTLSTLRRLASLRNRF